MGVMSHGISLIYFEVVVLGYACWIEGVLYFFSEVMRML